MARRNLFQPPAPPEPSSPESEDRPSPDPRPRFPNTGAISGMKSTLRELSSNAVREIEADMIEDSGPKDRLSIGDADVADLAESIRRHGQQVPIMVRTMPDRPGRYRIVYGRRRLRALRLLNLPAKALVRSLTDDQAVLAQGQENSQRLDPSFIEKALFAAELGSAGYDPEVILDALAIDRPMLSRMNKVARVVPSAVASLIGPAHGIGRRRWEDLADAVRDQGVDIEAIVEVLAENWAQDHSDERFARVAQAVARLDERRSAPTSRVAPIPISNADGSRVGEIQVTARAVTIRLSTTDDPGFTEWMRTNGADTLLRVYDHWKSSDGDA